MRSFQGADAAMHPESIPDVSLADQDPSVVNGLGQTQLENQGLQPALQKVLWSQSKHVIKLVLSVIQKTILVHTPQQGLALKQSLLRCLQLGQALCQPTDVCGSKLYVMSFV